MTIATVTITSLASGFTQSTLNSAIQTAFTNAGYSTLVDSFTSGSDLCSVYKLVQDNTKTYGTTYIRIRLTTAFAIFQGLYTAWNSTTHTGSNAGSESNALITLSNASPVTFTSYNGTPEYGIVSIINGSSAGFYGIVSPANIPSWWDLNQWNYGFCFNTSSFNNLVGTSLTPYSSSSYATFLGTSNMGVINPINSRRDVLTGILLLASTQGCAGRTSDDIGIGAVSGSTKGDTLAIYGTSQTYSVVNNVAGGLVIRTS